MEAFAPARALYTRAGFVPCAPFGEYTSNPHSMCLRREPASCQTGAAGRARGRT
jgi:hypothetical protein